MSETHPFFELIRQRCSVERFDPSRSLSDEQIRELVADASCTPSSFNLQHWRFLAVTADQDKDDLCAIAFGQEQVKQASVTFVVLGDLQALDTMPEINRRAVEQGALPQGKADAWERLAGGIYGDPALARDEALRSASLASMTLMLAAEARGLASGALSGFDAARLTQEFDLDARYLPVLLIAVGYPLERAEARQPRLEVDEVLRFGRRSDF